jgi:hypothetical protein
MAWPPLSPEAKARGFRSGLEVEIADQLDAHGTGYAYEPGRIRYTQPAKERNFTPYFILPSGIVIEGKGRFITADRTKFVYIKETHPDLDLRFIFSNPDQRISKTSKTTYAKWCEYKGFLWAGPVVPVEWLKEPINEKSLAVVRHLLQEHP